MQYNSGDHGGISLWQHRNDLVTLSERRCVIQKPVDFDPMAVARRLRMQRPARASETSHIFAHMPQVNYPSSPARCRSPSSPASCRAPIRLHLHLHLATELQDHPRKTLKKIKNAPLRSVSRKPEAHSSPPSPVVEKADTPSDSESITPLNRTWNVLCGTSRRAFPKRRKQAEPTRAELEVAASEPAQAEPVVAVSCVCSGQKGGIDEELVLWQVTCSPRRKAKPPAARRKIQRISVRRAVVQVNQYTRACILKCRELMQDEFAKTVGLSRVKVASSLLLEDSLNVGIDLKSRRSRSQVTRLTRAGPTWKVPLPAFGKHDADCKCDKGKEGRSASLPPGEKDTSFRLHFPASPQTDTPGEPPLRRELRSLLNKISPDNEYVIVDRLLCMLNDREGCESLATMIMEKATRDPFQSEVYARTTSRLALDSCVNVNVDKSGEVLSGPTYFKKCVLLECRKQYKLFFAGGLKLEAFDTETAEDEEKVEKAAKLRDRAQAVVRFFGNLYLERIVGLSLLEQCFNQCLQLETPLKDAHPPHQVWLECALELLETAGCKVLSTTTRGKTLQNDVMHRLKSWKDLCQPGTGGKEKVYALSTRMRVLICNTLDIFMS